MDSRATPWHEELAFDIHGSRFLNPAPEATKAKTNGALLTEAAEASICKTHTETILVIRMPRPKLKN